MKRERPHSRRASSAVCLALAAAIALVAAPSAIAAVFPLSADPRAEHPAIAVDDAGAAHVAWTLSAGIPADDQLVYCRVPRGAKACELTHAIALPGTDFTGPRVVLGRSGAVILVSGRCCFPALPVFAVSSADGGQTFGSPVQIAAEFSGGAEWEAAAGPGDFSLALSGGNSGPDGAAIWRAAPLDGSSPEPKAALAPFPQAYFTSTGFPAPTNPIAAYTDLDDVYLRQWSGSGDYNSAASWGPATHVVRGTEPKLASGPKGVYLIYRGWKPPYQYFVRRFDGAGFPVASQTTVSDPGTRQSAIFRDFAEDGGGNLHAAFRQRSARHSWGLHHRVSTDGGKSWKPVELLARGKVAEDLFNLRLGAGADGSGAIVGDHNGEGPVWFAPFGPSGGGGAACPATVKLGKAVARALEGCFKRDGGRYVAGGAVKLNGVDIEPLGGGGASASAAFRVIAVPGQRTLTTSAKANVRVGNVVLERGPVAWRLPAGDGKVVRLGSADGSVFRDLGKFARKLFEFPVDGDAELLIAGPGARVPANFRMPGLLGGVTGKTTLRTDQAGLALGGTKIKVPAAAIGLLRIAGVDVTYDGPNRFTGSAKVELPPAYSKPVEVAFGFEGGELSRLEVEPAIQFAPPLAIVGAPPTPLVGLDSIGFAYLRKPASRLFQGNLLLIAGPKLFGFQVADLDGSVALEFPSSGPTTLKANGDLSLVRLPLANAFATYTVGAPGSLAMGGSFQVLAISGSVKGHVDLASGAFSASGGASLGPLGGTVVITDKGMGACIDNPLGPDPGISWKWSSPVPSATCPDLGAGASAASSSAAVDVSVGGKGRKRLVRFRLPARPGQRVTFAEEAGRVYREIGASKRARGALRFRPAPGPGGKRRIVAIVEQGGVPYEKLVVARYKAPPSPRPRPPRRVFAARRGSTLVVSWKRVGGARGYEVRVGLPRDGRRLLFHPPAGKRGLRVRGIERSDLARVSVTALGPDLRPGKPAKAKLRPLKPRPRRR